MMCKYVFVKIYVWKRKEVSEAVYKGMYTCELLRVSKRACAYMSLGAH